MSVPLATTVPLAVDVSIDPLVALGRVGDVEDVAALIPLMAVGPGRSDTQELPTFRLGPRANPLGAPSEQCGRSLHEDPVPPLTDPLRHCRPTTIGEGAGTVRRGGNSVHRPDEQLGQRRSAGPDWCR